MLAEARHPNYTLARHRLIGEAFHDGGASEAVADVLAEQVRLADTKAELEALTEVAEALERESGRRVAAMGLREAMSARRALESIQERAQGWLLRDPKEAA